MRILVMFMALLLLAPSSLADKKKSTAAPIPVVSLNRKEPVRYTQDIEPILINKCMFCHSGPVKEGKLDMSSYVTLMKGGKSGPPIVAGKSAESMLVKRAGKTEKPFMPPKSEEPLTPQELALIKLWIDQGAKSSSGQRELPKVVVGL